MTNKLFIGGIAQDITSVQLEEYFKSAGNVLSANVITDRMSGQSKGFGFVEMSTVEEAKNAMQTLNNTKLGEKTIAVKEAKPRV